MTRKDEPLTEQRLDELLSALPAPEPSAALRRAVAEIPLRHPQRARGLFGPAPTWFPLRSFARAALLAAVALALGALAGLLTDDDVTASTTIATDTTLASDESGELAALVFADDLDAELEP